MSLCAVVGVGDALDARMQYADGKRCGSKLIASVKVRSVCQKGDGLQISMSIG